MSIAKRLADLVESALLGKPMPDEIPAVPEPVVEKEES